MFEKIKRNLVKHSPSLCSFSDVSWAMIFKAMISNIRK